MPSRGYLEHEYLKSKAMSKIIDIYGDKIDLIKNEQPQQNSHQNYIKVDIKIGSAWHDRFGASVTHFPDVLAQVRLSKSEQRVIAEERKKLIEDLDPKDRYGIMNRGVPDVKILIIECETSRSGLVTGVNSRRYHGYHLLRIQHLGFFTFILVTFKDIKAKSDLFDKIWKFPRRVDYGR